MNKSKKKLHKEASEQTFVEKWEKQDNEGDEKFAAFKIFVELGDGRRLADVAKKTKQNISRIHAWSWEWRWRERVVAWDRYEWRQLRKMHLKEVSAMRKRHADIARGMLDKAAKYVEQMLSGELEAKEIAKWVDVAAKLERLSLGETTENIKLATDDAGPPDEKLFRDPEVRRLLDQAAARSARLEVDPGSDGGEA